MAWNKFKTVGFILADILQKLEMEKDVLESCVFPVLSYDTQTWSLTEKEKKMLQICHRKREW
jgi:hypothetical protein